MARRVVLDLRPLYDPVVATRGRGVYLSQLLEHLHAFRGDWAWDFLLDARDLEGVAARAGLERYAPRRLIPSPPIGWRVDRTAWKDWRFLRRTLDSSGLFHVPFQQQPLPFLPGRLVCTVLDLFLWDRLDALPPRVHLRLRGMRRLWNLAIRRAARIVAISEATRNDVVRRFPALSRKVVVIPLASRYPRRFPPREAGRPVEGRILSIGTIDPHKNTSRLLAAAGMCQKEFPSLSLRVVGTSLPPDLPAEIRRAGLEGSVEVLGRIDDLELERIFHEWADILVFPSTKEGFGLPVLEAMAMGVPVVASDIPVLREVGGDSFEAVDPGDEASIARAVSSLLRDSARYEARRAQGLARAALFSWRETARRTAEVYAEVLG